MLGTSWKRLGYDNNGRGKQGYNSRVLSGTVKVIHQQLPFPGLTLLQFEKELFPFRI